MEHKEEKFLKKAKKFKKIKLLSDTPEFSEISSLKAENFYRHKKELYDHIRNEIPFLH